MHGMQHLDREEYIEQAYFFRVFRERIAANISAQEILERVHEEILSTTRLPLAIQFLATEFKHSGCLSTGFARLAHYFTPFQAFVVRQTENEATRLDSELALMVLEREAQYRAGENSPTGLFVFQFEVLCRNRLGYDHGLAAMVGDPCFDSVWREYVEMVRRQIGVVDFPDLIFLRSDFYVEMQRRQDPQYQPRWAPLFGVKEGKIANANRGRDPLYLFAALQRQLGYPEVPRPIPRDDLGSKVETLQARLREMDMRMKLMESEMRGQLDLKTLAAHEIIAPSLDD
jgi:hypothetical protein